ncbi:MAG: hypothetical protein HKN62_08940 [Phycisphaerales bacterium]|nr:hypothetical protein [Phycisphaerales bacterium]
MMSTERKPGSRGVRDPFALDRANAAPRFGAEPGPREKTKKKGSTKTASPAKGFKKRKK